ncbi:PREDICTED: LOW QUALITY PROTEIN: cytoskeleton-associated protein 2 [Chinchilla lanigera]|uniref:LOW QUALITY PROTEIN: cytoskeleton-associated protein 2 n=1 Tax=Chinchilla lanigera TaxID=34839 RepID=UPI000695C26E|nr:PREDICTED: LOW QUALITY PROTEIN: cytoskeleton-associated protein 2 [Chinchilla lanigera]
MGLLLKYSVEILQRRQIFKEYPLKRKITFDIKEENQISSNRVMTSEDQVQEGSKLLKLKTKMADKENIRRHTESTNTTMEKNYIPLKASTELTNSTTAIETHYLEADNQTLQLLPVNSDSQNQNMTLSKAFHLKKNHKKNQMITEKPKQDANVFKKPMLGYYHGHIVQSKINSFRKPLQVKDESFATTNKLSTTFSKGTKPNSVNTSSVTIRSHRTSKTTATTKFENTTSRNTQLLRPPIRNHHSNIQNKVKQDISRTSANSVSVQKKPTEKELLQSETVLCNVKSNSQDTKSKAFQSKTVLPRVKTTSQDIKRSKAFSQNMASKTVARPVSFTNAKLTEKPTTIDQRRHTLAKATVDGSAQPKETAEENRSMSWNHMASENVARPVSITNTKLKEKSQTIDQQRHTLAKAAVDRSAQPKETAEERKARLNEWRAGKGRVLKRPPNSVATQPEPERQNENPVGSFWTTMAEEDEQRLFTDKINKTFSECLNLINKGCPKEEIITTLNDLIKNIPDAKKLVKYWICLIRIESIASPIENIISLYEKAVLAGAQPIEEMRQTIVDIITMKNQEKDNCGQNTEDACITNEQIQEINTEDTGVNLEPGKPEMENKHNRNVVFEDCEPQQDDKGKDSTDNFKTPDKENRSSCVIKYNISTTPYLQSIKKKMQLDETNSAFKELKFLTPVRRSRRLQEKNSKLPDMLKDHYPCVSSLEQLSELGGETDAFVCRPNIALCPMYSETDTSEEK